MYYVLYVVAGLIGLLLTIMLLADGHQAGTVPFSIAVVTLILTARLFQLLTDIRDAVQSGS